MYPVMKSRSKLSWQEGCEVAGVPAGPINSIAESFADPQIVHRGMRLDMEHPLAGSAPGVANPIKFSSTPVCSERAPPLLGQHTREILHERLQLSASDLQMLESEGVIQCANG